MRYDHGNSIEDLGCGDVGDGWIQWWWQVWFLPGKFDEEGRESDVHWSTCHGNSGTTTKDSQHLFAEKGVVGS